MEGTLAVFLAALLAFAMGIALHRVRGTTLAAPTMWAVAAASCLAIVEAALGWRGETGDGAAASASLARYAAAVGSCCPLIAVLGAKRPQDRGWQWVVLSLWAVLLVPAGQAWAARTGAPLELSGPWRVLLGSLIGLGLLNYLPTRFGVAALIFAAGQLALFANYLFVEPLESLRHARITALVLMLLAVVVAYAMRRRFATQGLEKASPLSGTSERWLRFRDGWGAFWGLRILQRVNEAAELSRWHVRLEWGGFVSAGAAAEFPQVDEPRMAHIRQTMDTLLRRFERVDGSPAGRIV
jgi:hypothetical protein